MFILDALNVLVNAFIKVFEGCRLTAYPDPGTGGEPWTNGWGHTGPDVKQGTVWTQEHADQVLESDALKYLLATMGLCPKVRDAKKLSALADFAYNLGPTRLAGSTLRRKVNAGDWEGAKREVVKWVWAGGHKLPGLIRRRKLEASYL